MLSFFLFLFLSLFFRGVVFRLQPYICYTKRHIGIQTQKEKGFNFELYKFYYLLLTTYLLPAHYIVLSTYLNEHSMYVCL